MVALFLLEKGHYRATQWQSLAKGETIGQACHKIGVTEQTYYRWRREFGGLTIDQAKRFREIERENSQLKKLVADLSLANAVLKEVAQSKL